MAMAVETVRMQEIEGRGRSLMAARPIKAGDIIVRESPLLVYPNPCCTTTTLYCCNCFRALVPSPQVPSCQSCNKILYFCSPECYSRAQKTSHTPWVCNTLNMLRSLPLDDSEFQVQAQFLIAAYNLAIVDSSKFQQLMMLQGNGGAVVEPQVQQLHSFLSNAFGLGFWPQHLPGFCVEMTAALLAKDNLNAFGLMAPLQPQGERQVRAYAIYALSSFFNHDCLPNACRFDYVDRPGEGNTDIIVRSLHDIKEGSEICISYFAVNWPYCDRQKRLLEEYGFVCKCDRCTVEEAWSDKESMDEGDSDNAMEEETNETQMDDTVVEDADEEKDDFPHAYFFVRYMCPADNCGGTMAPLPPSGSPSTTMECNMCGLLRTEDEFNADVREHGMSD